MPDRTTPLPSTAAELIDVLTLEVLHHDVPLLSMAKTALDHPASLGRLVEAVAGTRAQIPAAVDSVGGSMVVPTIVVVVNALVAGTLGDGQDEVPGYGRPRRMGWWSRRRLARRLGRRLAPSGAATPLPRLSAGQMALVVAETRAIAVNARLTDQEADDLCRSLESTLYQVADRA